MSNMNSAGNDGNVSGVGGVAPHPGKPAGAELPCVRELTNTIKVTPAGACNTVEIVAVETQVVIEFSGFDGGGSGGRPEGRFDGRSDGRRIMNAWASPCDLADLACGMAFTSGLINTYQQVQALDISLEGKVVHIAVQLAEGNDAYDKSGGSLDLRSAPLAQEGAVAAGAGTAAAAAPVAAPQAQAGPPAAPLSPQAIWTISNSLLTMQTMHQITGATHAAVFANTQGQPLYLREDVGRHNAVDKLIGALLKHHVDPRQGFVFLSSRCALDLVTKCARYGINIVATVSAPTSAVIDFAQQNGITLCAYARKKRFTIYTNPQRIQL